MGDCIRGGAGPLGGGAAVALGGGPYNPADGGPEGGAEGLPDPGNGDVMGATGVDLRGTALVTKGTSFQLSVFLARLEGGAEGVEDELRGGALVRGGGGTMPAPAPG